MVSDRLPSRATKTMSNMFSWCEILTIGWSRRGRLKLVSNSNQSNQPLRASKSHLPSSGLWSSLLVIVVICLLALNTRMTLAQTCSPTVDNGRRLSISYSTSVVDHGMKSSM